MTDRPTWMTEYYAAWDAADVDAITGWFDDDVVFVDVPSGHAARGLDEVRKFVESALDKSRGATYEIVTGLMDGNSFAVEWIMHPVGLRGASVGELRDGAIVSNTDYWSAERTS